MKLAGGKRLPSASAGLIMSELHSSTEMGISPNAVVVAADNQISSELSGEAVILDLRAGMYYGLDSIGARIWSLIQEPKAVADLRDTLVGEYEVDPESCERDLLTLLRQLATNRLIKVME